METISKRSGNSIKALRQTMLKILKSSIGKRCHYEEIVLRAVHLAALRGTGCPRGIRGVFEDDMLTERPKELGYGA